MEVATKNIGGAACCRISFPDASFFCLQNREGIWFVRDAKAYRLDFYQKLLNGLPGLLARRGLAQSQLALGSVQFIGTTDDGADYKLLRTVPQATLERQMAVLQLSELRQLLPVSVSDAQLAASLPARELYTVTPDGHLMRYEAFNRDGFRLRDLSMDFEYRKNASGTLPDSLFALDSSLPRVPVGSFAELKSLVAAN
jgi:hypothetical protein